jgi:hypothetical protein
MIFIETPIFTRQIKDLMNDDDYATFQAGLAVRPDAGDVMPGTNGLRKIRVAASGRGKRGGARVIYYHFVNQSQIALLLAYPKNEQDNLTPDQQKALAAIVKNWR